MRLSLPSILSASPPGVHLILPRLSLSLAISFISFLTTIWGEGVVFTWLISLTGISALLVWGTIGAISLRFRAAWKAQGRAPSDLPYVQPLFPVLPQGFRDVITATLGNVAADTKTTDAYLLPAVHRARLTKDAYEVAEIRRASEISSRAHETVMRVLGLGVKHLQEGKTVKAQGRPLLPGEWLIEKEAEAEALFVASCRREGYVKLTSCLQRI